LRQVRPRPVVEAGEVPGPRIPLIEGDADLVLHPEQPQRILGAGDPALGETYLRDRLEIIGPVPQDGVSVHRQEVDLPAGGYDDQREIVAYTRPPLTTMRLPYYEMGGSAVSAILDGRSFRREMLWCEPVLRGSLGPVRAAGGSGRK
jgi:hypothetical protein